MVGAILELMICVLAGMFSLFVGVGLVDGHLDPTPVIVLWCGGSAFASGLALAFAIDLISHEVRR